MGRGACFFHDLLNLTPFSLYLQTLGPEDRGGPRGRGKEARRAKSGVAGWLGDVRLVGAREEDGRRAGRRALPPVRSLPRSLLFYALMGRGNCPKEEKKKKEKKKKK